jgi:hypothetical protein
MLPDRLHAAQLTCAILCFGLSSSCDGSGSGSGVPGGSIEGVNASEERVQAVAEGVCRRNARCRKAQFEGDYDSIEECTSDRAFSYRPHNAADHVCADAYMDQAACYAGLDCDEDQRKECGELQDRVTPACD